MSLLNNLLLPVLFAGRQQSTTVALICQIWGEAQVWDLDGVDAGRCGAGARRLRSLQSWDSERSRAVWIKDLDRTGGWADGWKCVIARMLCWARRGSGAGSPSVRRGSDCEREANSPRISKQRKWRAITEYYIFHIPQAQSHSARDPQLPSLPALYLEWDLRDPIYSWNNCS